MEKEIKLAAKWWADKLKGNFEHDNGVLFQSAMMNMIPRTPYTPEQIEKFEKVLGVLLLAEILKGQPVYYIHVDYDAARCLIAACHAADIDYEQFLFPVKTHMVIKPGSVTVKQGYNAESVEIFNKE